MPITAKLTAQMVFQKERLMKSFGLWPCVVRFFCSWRSFSQVPRYCSVAGTHPLQGLLSGAETCTFVAAEEFEYNQEHAFLVSGVHHMTLRLSFFPSGEDEPTPTPRFKNKESQTNSTPVCPMLMSEVSTLQKVSSNMRAGKFLLPSPLSPEGHKSHLHSSAHFSTCFLARRSANHRHLFCRSWTLQSSNSPLAFVLCPQHFRTLPSPPLPCWRDPQPSGPKHTYPLHLTVGIRRRAQNRSTRRRTPTRSTGLTHQAIVMEDGPTTPPRRTLWPSTSSARVTRIQKPGFARRVLFRLGELSPPLTQTKLTMDTCLSTSIAMGGL